jgi:hypothetical protein
MLEYVMNKCYRFFHYLTFIVSSGKTLFDQGLFNGVTTLLGGPVELGEDELADEVSQAHELLDEESRQPLLKDPGSTSVQMMTDEDVRVLREKHSFLRDFLDQFIRTTQIGDLMRIQSTALKAKELEKSREVEDRLASNKASLVTTFTLVDAGRDNRQTVLHSSRFLPGATCSTVRLWLAAREVLGLEPFKSVSSYDMTSVGLAGHVSARGWAELHCPASTKLSIKMFSINICVARASKKLVDEDIIMEIGEFKLALRTLRTAMSFVMPWNFSILALEGFYFQTNFCANDLSGVDKKSWMLVKFTDYVLAQNADRWRDAEPFLTAGELKTAWASFFGSQPLATVQNKFKKEAPRKFDPRIGLGICFGYNNGTCSKQPGTCTTAKGRPLKHVCDFVADASKPTEICGQEHKRKDVHK